MRLGVDRAASVVDTSRELSAHDGHHGLCVLEFVLCHVGCVGRDVGQREEVPSNGDVAHARRLSRNRRGLLHEAGSSLAVPVLRAGVHESCVVGGSHLRQKPVYRTLSAPDALREVAKPGSRASASASRMCREFAQVADAARHGKEARNPQRMTSRTTGLARVWSASWRSSGSRARKTASTMSFVGSSSGGLLPRSTSLGRPLYPVVGGIQGWRRVREAGLNSLPGSR